MRHCLFLACVVMFSLSVNAQSDKDSTVWLTEVTKAHALSSSTGKPIFAFFTGSDWCGWCRKLQTEVFAKPAFKEWSAEKVVLLELDFPARKTLPPEIVGQNQSLKSFFKVTGFPTIWLFCITEDQQKEKHFLISPYGSLGYPKNPTPGQEEIQFLEEAKNILASRTCQ
jgi:thioredoxin-related protein